MTNIKDSAAFTFSFILKKKQKQNTHFFYDLSF